MEEIKNETINPEVEETKEVSKKEKKQVKSFKMNESQKQRVDELLAKIEGDTESEKLLDVLELAIKRNEMSELPQNLNDSFEGDRQKIATAIKLINTTFDSLMVNTSEVLESREAEIKATHQTEVDGLLSQQAKLNKQIETLKEDISESQVQCEAAKQNEVNAKEEVQAIRTDMELKDKVIEGLTSQLEELKAEMVQLKADSKANAEKLESQLAKKDNEIAELVTDSRKYKEKIEVLEAKNEELMTKSTKSQQENQALTGKLSILEVNFKNEKDKNTDLKNQIEKLQLDLDVQHQSKDNLQANLIQLMSQLSQTNQTTGKDTINSNTVKQENANTQPKTQKQVKKPFAVLDQSGKELWSGNKNGLVKYVNNLQNKKEVTTSTNISEIEELLHPFTLVTPE